MSFLAWMAVALVTGVLMRVVLTELIQGDVDRLRAESVARMTREQQERAATLGLATAGATFSTGSLHRLASAIGTATGPSAGAAEAAGQVQLNSSTHARG